MRRRLAAGCQDSKSLLLQQQPQRPVIYRLCQGLMLGQGPTLPHESSSAAAPATLQEHCTWLIRQWQEPAVHAQALLSRHHLMTFSTPYVKPRLSTKTSVTQHSGVKPRPPY